MSTSDSLPDWRALEKQLDALLDLPSAEREVRLLELDQNDPFHARALRQWLEDIEQAERNPLAQTHDGERIGPWRAVHRLGRGGMGDVWMAERHDGTYEKRVAIKFLYGDTPQLRARLEMERHLLAQLQHPNIPRLIDGGVTSGGQPYLITDFVEGMPLDRWSQTAQAADVDARIHVFRQVAAAVAHAHDHTVAHRDIKPNNVLVDRGGNAHLLDFGVARLLNEERRADTLQPLTLEYAAPEQVRNGKASVRTDIYGLGALLYFLIARKPPFDFHNLPIATCVKRICEDMPVRPSATGAASDLPHALVADLDAIALKALAKSPDDRYASVEDLLQDLDDAFAHRPIEARKLDGGAYRVRRFVRRNALALGVSTAIGLSLAGGMVLALWQAHIAAQQRDAAQAARAVAETERTNARAQAARSDMTVDFLLSVLGSAAPNNEAIKIDDLLGLATQRVMEEAKSRPELFPLLLDSLKQAYGQRGNWQAFEQLLLPLLTDPKNAFPPSVSAELACSLAGVEWNLYKWDEVRRWTETGLQHLATLAPEQARETRANCQHALASLDVQAGKLDRALEFYRQAVSDMGNAPIDTSKNARIYGEYAETLTLADKPVEARALFRKAIDMYTRLGRESSADAMGFWGQMAYCTSRVGFPLQAFDEMRHGVELNLKATGPSDNIAVMLFGQAQIALDLVRTQEAASLLVRSQTMVRDYAPKQMERFGVYWSILRIRLAGFAGQEAERMAGIAEAHQVLDSLGLPPESPLRRSVQDVEISSSTTAKASSPQELFDRFERAERRLRALGSLSKPVLSKTMLGGAEAALDAGHTDLAVKKVEEAREFYKAIADPEGWQFAVCDAVVAVDDWQSGKDRPRARTNLERALARLQAALGADHPRVSQWRTRMQRLDA